MAPSTLDDLPRAARALIPEVGQLRWRDQTRADCSACVMLPVHSGEDPAMPWAFRPETRCCTYHPEMANFLVGQALGRGGPGAEVIRRRLGDPSGVSPLGIDPSESWRARRDQVGTAGFGRDPALRCPFWVGGTYSCGVWRDRNAVCRTWFCRHDRGLRAAHELTWFRIALTEVESLLAELCVEEGNPPADGAEVEAWCRWFLWCAGRASRASDDELAARERPALRDARARLAELCAQPEPELPERVVPSVEKTWERGGRVRVAGYSDFDPALAPRSVFLFLSKLDGETGWREALAQANAEAEEPLEESEVRDLFRAGALEPPRAPAGPKLPVLPLGAGPDRRD